MRLRDVLAHRLRAVRLDTSCRSDLGLLGCAVHVIDPALIDTCWHGVCRPIASAIPAQVAPSAAWHRQEAHLQELSYGGPCRR